MPVPCALGAELGFCNAHRQASQQRGKAHQFDVLEDPHDAEESQQPQQANGADGAGVQKRPRAVAPQ